ncbi:MAG: hypothetical protein COV47_02915 [Candidatus Diapherotrites archaeon CG11_big_fil_rev_8_21_14_0_20_37_9]|nr:MAG: hypothetical protein COV47_02915 [Candidatus Diapherotrites archaeon CG11_big_fil_rev_8_21_14_0_20_37_9]
MKYTKEFREKFSKKSFTTKDVKIFLENKGANKNYYSLFLANEMKNNRIFRLKQGFYSFTQNLEDAEKLFQPSYHGLQDALSIHGIWGQQTIPILITPRKIRTGTRTIMGQKILTRKISRKMFYGFESKKHHSTWISVSDPEKTLIDFAYYHEPLDEESIRNILKKADKTKIREYLKRTSKKTQKKVNNLINQFSK